MELKKTAFLLASIFFMAGFVSAGSSYLKQFNTDSDWSSGYNISNITYGSDSLSNIRNKIKYVDNWNDFSSSSGFDVSSSKIVQSQNQAWSTRDFKSSQDSGDFVGGVFDGDLVGEQSHYQFDGGETDMIGSGLDYDTPSEHVTSNWFYQFSTLDGNEKSTTVSCSDGSHTIAWGYDGSDPYVKYDGVKETLSSGVEWQYSDHSNHDISCNNVANDEYINPDVISGDVYWEIGNSVDDIAHTEGDNINYQSKPVDEYILTPSGNKSSISYSIGATDPDTITQVNIDTVFEGATGVAVDGGSGNDDDIFVYEVDADGSVSQQCKFVGAIAPDSTHTMASVNGDLSFGSSKSNDIVTVSDNNNFEFLDRGESGGDSCNDKVVSNPTSGTLTGVASNIRDVDEDGNSEIVFTVGSGGDHDSNGYIHHADFSLSGFTDVRNTSIQTSEGDVGYIRDWDADNSPEIPYRDVSSNLKLANYDNSLSSSGSHVAAKESSRYFEPLSAVSWYETPKDGVLDMVHLPTLNTEGGSSCGLEDMPENSLTLSDPDKVELFFCGYSVNEFQLKFNYSGLGSNSEKVEILNYTFKGESYPGNAEWNSSNVDMSVNDPTPNKIKPYAVPTGFGKDVSREVQSGFVNASNVTLSVATYDSSSGGWSGFYNSSNLDDVPPGTKMVLKANFTRNVSDIGVDLDLEQANLSYEYSPYPKDPVVYNESIDVQYVQAGFKGSFRVTEIDSDGVEEVNRTNVSLTMPDGGTKSSGNINSNIVSNTDSGDTVEFTFTPSADPSNLGQGSYTVEMEDISGNVVSKSGNFQIKDEFPPSYRNLAQESSSVEEGQVNNLSVDAKDKVEVDKVRFYVDTGSGFSKVSTKDVSIGDSFTEVSYGYDTSSLNDGDSVDWKAELVDTEGNALNTSVKSFSIVGLKLIENVTVDYRDIGSGSVDKFMTLKLDQNENISDHGAVSGADTVSFTDTEWKLENFTVPFSENLTVNNSDGASTTHEVDFNVSVKDIAGHPENANPTYQEKNKSIIVDNSGDSIDMNVSCVNNGYGNEVSSSVDTVFGVLSGSTESHACRWSGDWITEDYRDYDPTVSSVEIDELLSVDREVYLENNQSVMFPKVNLSGYAEPDNTCSITNNDVFSVTADGNKSNVVDFDCDIGDSGSPQLTLSSVDGYTEYSYGTTLNVSSDLAENISISWEFNKSELQDWSSKDSGSAVAYVKSTKDDILLVESSDKVEVIVPDDAFSSSLHEGEHQASVEYTKGDDGGSDSDSSAGSSGGSFESGVEVTENITGEYNWSFSSPRSPGEDFFNLLGWGGRDLSRTPVYLEVRNRGEANFTINFSCESSGDACDWVELSDSSVQLDTLEGRSRTIRVTGQVPDPMPDEGYRFNIRASDPSFVEGRPELGGVATARFRVQKAPIQSIPIRIITKLFSFREIDFDGEDGQGEPIPYPFVAVPLLLSLIAFGIISALIRQTDERFKGNGLKLGVAVIVFVLAFGLL